MGMRHATGTRVSSRRKSRGRPLLVASLVLVLVVLGLPAVAAGGVASAATRTDGQKIVALARQADAEFGRGVAIDRDNTVVGSSGWSFFGDDKGLANGFVWAESGWDALPNSILASDPGADDRFGYSAAIDGDTLVVGAMGENLGKGAAYVYEWSGTDWDFKQKLVAPARQDGARFGASVDVHGDWMIVGAPLWDMGGLNNVGLAYLFVRRGSTWEYSERIGGDGTDSSDLFGEAVAIDGNRLIVGAPGVDSDEGAAFTFEYDGTEWIDGQELGPWANASGGYFGDSVDLSGDYAIVGIPNSSSDRGSAAVFRRWILDSWGMLEPLRASDGEAGDEFGHDVAIEGDIAVVGAPRDNDDGNSSGSAYVFDRVDETYEGWVERDKLLASDGEAGDSFGWALDMSGDTAVVTAPFDDGNRGAAYVFEDVLGPYAPVEIAGATRYDTAIAASKAAFPHGADTVVIATGENWPDALGGAALAGAYDGPILLTRTATVPDAVIAEIDRLNAEDAVILGGPGAVSPAAEARLASGLGSTTFRRIGGATRYETADLIARAVKTQVGDLYDGTAFVATGLNFPDALAASPLSAAGPSPIFLAPPTGLTPSSLATMSDIGVDEVIVLGGTGVVSQAIEDGLGPVLSADVTRLSGPTRYETAVEVATYGVEEAHLRWNGVALATGENFPDALAGGPVQGRARSVMLLTHTATLTPATGAALQAEARDIARLRFLGGLGAISQATRDSVKAILE